MSIAATNLEAVEKGSNHSDDTSSDEADRRRRTEKPAAVGRSYECTFCKRGFTNAQALGGHMNIHRKDKLKAKQKSSLPQQQQQQGSSPSPNSQNTHHQLYESSRYLVQIPTDQQPFYPSPRAQHVGYLFYPSYQQVVHPNDNTSKPETLRLHGDLMGANLTLRIGEDDEESNKEELEKSEVVDLELRLGNHKYS